MSLNLRVHCKFSRKQYRNKRPRKKGLWVELPALLKGSRLQTRTSKGPLSFVGPTKGLVVLLAAQVQHLPMGDSKSLEL